MIATLVQPESSPSKIKQWTYDDYARLPHAAEDAIREFVRYEVIDGELLISPAPTFFHPFTVGEIFALLRDHVNAHGLGIVMVAPFDVLLDAHNTVEPDVLWLSHERRHLLAARGVEGAPDLVVEVISPTSDRRDRIAKFGLYARFNVPFYWIADPVLRLLEEFVLDGGEYRLVREWREGEVFAPFAFPGLSLEVSALFASL